MFHLNKKSLARIARRISAIATWESMNIWHDKANKKTKTAGDETLETSEREEVIKDYEASIDSEVGDLGQFAALFQ